MTHSVNRQWGGHSAENATRDAAFLRGGSWRSGSMMAGNPACCFFHRGSKDAIRTCGGDGCQGGGGKHGHSGGIRELALTVCIFFAVRRAVFPEKAALLPGRRRDGFLLQRRRVVRTGSLLQITMHKGDSSEVEALECNIPPLVGLSARSVHLSFRCVASYTHPTIVCGLGQAGGLAFRTFFQARR
jgi:hypothetical protein